MKNVLVLSYYFPPRVPPYAIGGMQRVLQFVRYLPQYGWLPEVVTVKPYSWGFTDERLRTKVPLEMQIHSCYSLEMARLPIGLRTILSAPPWVRFRHLFEVPDHSIGWLPFALLTTRTIIAQKKIDVLYSTFPPSVANLVAYLLKKENNIPWIADFRDPWVHGRLFDLGTPRMYRGLVRRLERVVLSSANKIIVTADSLKREFLATYSDLKDDKICTISNGFDEDDFSGSANHVQAEEFIIIYTGYLPGETLHPLWTAIANLVGKGVVEKKRLRVFFTGYVNQEGIRQSAAQFGLEQTVSFKGYLPHHKKMELVDQADVLLLHSRGWRNSIPGKTYEYLRARRPILLLAEEGNDTAALIRNSGAGIVVPPENECSIADALLALYKNKLAGVNSYIASDEFIAQFERRTLTKRLAEVLDEISSGG